MDKKTFIGELERALSVLQEDELKDIIGEYEQHIDMKVQSGLTEEEAITDLGSLTELSAEILEAYHVRADYAAEKKKDKRFFLANKERVGKELISQTGEACARTGKQTMKWLKHLGVWFFGVLMFWKARLLRPLAWAEGTSVMWRGGAGLMKKSRNTCTRLFAAGIQLWWCAARWCVRIGWNAFWIGFACFCGGMGLFFLYGLGFLVVMLAQGYPLLGLTLGCLGLNLCLFAATGFSLTLLWRKQKPVLHLAETEGGQHA